ncbi:hypothetical protein [Actinoplanes couchii]|uniref:Integral membrane protein n=1 Tax=Actinoplanes couchii TaxID=403638 RepID=A0ABQ3XLD9_9ACTN|nr:hypothetical protein [Actinoplanes couchii]MDR6318308.1 hypothetical protein [Actinoplanes couchii]GID59323.1 hypothetical protein Aco03nite_077270 [Actinoplanes couchii]
MDVLPVRPWPTRRKVAVRAAAFAGAGIVAGVLAMVFSSAGKAAIALLLWAMIMFAGAAVSTALLVVLRRHPGMAPQPDWSGAPELHKETLRAIRDQKQHPHAVAEATRICRSGPVMATGLIAAFAGLPVLIVLALNGHVGRFILYGSIALLLLGAYRTVEAVLLWRRARAYLRRYPDAG